MRNLLARNNEDGKRMTSICHTRPSGAMFGLPQAQPFRNPEWTALMQLPSLTDRLAALRDPATGAALIKSSRESGFTADPAKLHPMGTGDIPDYDLQRANSLQQIADATGTDPVEVYVERLIESEGRELWNYWAFGGALENQWASTTTISKQAIPTT
ncbi:MAG: hypothetical protein OXI90_16890 [Gammaproteobacteria bacterium]|nr:hypothetical protein [Gammaproteobacteria bacterium]